MQPDKTDPLTADTPTLPPRRPGDPPPPAFPPPALPGSRYRPLRFHDKGALGEIYVAHDGECNREVALKLIQVDQEDDEASRARFLREAEITAQLQHPGIVPVYGLFASADGRPHYAMRFIAGETLHEAVQRFHTSGGFRGNPAERGLALRQLLAHFIAVCNAVAYAHSRGVIHRDLKPKNIMIGKYGETLVVDWGLARTFQRTETERATGEESVTPPRNQGADVTQVGQVVGTPAFMSPEQATGRSNALGPASDVYSLGATLYFLLTGQLPFRDGPLDDLLIQVALGQFQPPRRRNRDVPSGLDAICCKAMALRPADRYATALDLANDVSRWLADEPVTARPEPLWERVGRLSRKHARFLAGLSATPLWLIPLIAFFYHFVFHGFQTSRSDAISLAGLQTKSRLFHIASAYHKARGKLHRPPLNAAELKPFLWREEDLLVPESGQPFVIAWGEDLLSLETKSSTRLMAWEPVVDVEGGRWAWVVGKGKMFDIEYLSEEEFQQLRTPPAPKGPPRQPPRNKGPAARGRVDLGATFVRPYVVNGFLDDLPDNKGFLVTVVLEHPDEKLGPKLNQVQAVLRVRDGKALPLRKDEQQQPVPPRRVTGKHIRTTVFIFEFARAAKRHDLIYLDLEVKGEKCALPIP